MQSIQDVPQGTATSPQGFLAGATAAGIKEGTQRLDLALLYSTVPCLAVGVFTRNRIKAAPVLLCREHLADGRARAVVANSGCANACTGPQGLGDAREMALLAARKLGMALREVLVMSTGVIGVPLPMERIRQGMARIEVSAEGGHDLAQAIMTTDTHPKERAVSFELEGRRAVIGGVAKGAGMIHPDLATLLCVLTSDVAVEESYLGEALRQAVDLSFNMVSIDGDTSTNDTVLLLANGLAGNPPVHRGSPLAGIFQEALNRVCLHLAKEIARDGEGATRLIEARVEGAASPTEARAAARTIVSSPLVKAAVHGADPNWGRVLAALGRSGAQVEEGRVEVYLADLCLMKEGQPLPFDPQAARRRLLAPEVALRVRLNLGEHQATAWGCDLTEEYVTINSAYTT